MKKEQLKKANFLSHIEQLRWHLVYSFLAICLFTIISFINIKIIFDKFIFSFVDPTFLHINYFVQFLKIYVSILLLCSFKI